MYDDCDGMFKLLCRQVDGNLYPLITQDAVKRLAELDPNDFANTAERQQLLHIVKYNAPQPVITTPVNAPSDVQPATTIATHDGWQFTVDGEPFFCAGTNIYGIAIVEWWTNDAIINTLTYHASRGVNCIRLYVGDMCGVSLEHT